VLSCGDIVISNNFLSTCVRLEADRASKRIVDFKGWHEYTPVEYAPLRGTQEGRLS
jgi:hypothetical protein